MDQITISGAPRERGRQYGERAAARIHHAISCYQGLFARRAGLDWPAAVGYALGYVRDIETFAPDCLLEMQGIAEGAKVPFEAILALNCRSELMFAAPQGAARPLPGECTSFAITPTGSVDGHVLIGQNWDWTPFARDLAVCVEVRRENKPSFLTIVEAGMLAKVGVNEAGLGLCTNTLVSTRDGGQRGVPYHVMLRSLLDVDSVESAGRLLASVDRALSANYLLADRSGDAANFETIAGGAGGIRVIQPHDGRLAHANHFLDEQFAEIDAYVGHGPHSLTRLASMDRNLAATQRLSVSSMQTILRGHDHPPNGICSHPDPAADPLYARVTVASVISDLTTGEVWFSDGPPCVNPYHRHRLPGRAATS